MRLVYLFACLFLVSGCAITPEERAYNERILGDQARQWNQQQSAQQAAPKNCVLVDMGGGFYSQNCQ